MATTPPAQQAAAAAAVLMPPTCSTPVVQAVQPHCSQEALLVSQVQLQLPARALVAPAVAAVQAAQVVLVAVPHTAQVAAVPVGASTAPRLVPVVRVVRASS